MQTKILVIKLGYSETLDAEIGRVPSLGDVVRTTPILHALKEKYPQSHVTWLVAEEAEPFLKGNPYIDRLIVWDEFVSLQLMREKFDILINLEKIPGVCALADMVDAWMKFGFRFDSLQGSYHAYEKGLSFIDYLNHKSHNGTSKDVWQKVLIDMLGVPWRQQDYILGYAPVSTQQYDIGFNHIVGSKWPNKAMPQEKWKELEQKLVSLGHSITWQRGLDNAYEYIDWLNSCRIIITQDSLGMHLGLALKKQLVVLFGPTDPGEVFSYDRAQLMVSPQPCPVMPCLKPVCQTKLYCMNCFNTDDIVAKVQSL